MWLLSYVHRKSTQIKRFCSKSERLIFNDSCKVQKNLPNATFGSVRLKELCVFFACFFFFFFFLLIAWSKFVICAYVPHIARFQFQKYKIFSFWECTHPSDIPFVCKRAIGADAPPNHPPMSKTDINVQPCVILVY